jgi:hypothetical protein
MATSAALRELLRPPNGHADFGVEGHSALQARRTNAMPSKMDLDAQVASAAPMFHSVDENSHPNLHS